MTFYGKNYFRYYNVFINGNHFLIYLDLGKKELLYNGN